MFQKWWRTKTGKKKQRNKTRFRFCNRIWFILQILLPAIFVCLAMIVSQIRPFSEMPALELNTDMFLKVDPHEHYLPFAEDGDRPTFMTKDMTENLVRYPGVGKQIIFLLGVRIAFLFNSCMRHKVTSCSRWSGYPIRIPNIFDLNPALFFIKYSSSSYRYFSLI